MKSAPARSPLMRVGTLAVAGVLLVGVGQAAAGTDDRESVPRGQVMVDGQETPILGSFVYHQFMDDTNQEIRGFVHGVRRIDGGTVLYYSVGGAGGADVSTFRGSMAFPNSSFPYKTNTGVDLRLIDADGLAAYWPLFDAETTFASSTPDLDGNVGDLRVGYAIFPELPPEVTTVQVVMPWGTAVGDIPVEEGPLEPVGDEPGPLLGEGWPAIPSAADLAGADRLSRTFTLVRRSGDAEGTSVTEESPEQVATTLDANVLFATGSAELSPAAQDVLAGVAADIAARGEGEVVVTGHTDSDGSDASNQTLSEQRAASVTAVLQQTGGAAVTFTAIGEGENEPGADNGTDEGKQQNRRVTVVYSVQGDS
ncbi:OmpA family protein [Cellulomonas sp. KRMCY2]|uniref:OmpA family protein n=1 Tax=Cellulomonas sp. KRMCY2 TaxID=1304865 RepID=UPI0004B77D9A|nr:OmpA family protein [Cellulomonas sp. KRMCY2]